MNSGLVGDSLEALPVLAHYAKIEQAAGRALYVAFYAQDVLGIFPKQYGIKNAWDIPKSMVQQVIQTSASDAWGFGDRLHMSQAHFAYLKLPVPPAPVRPPISLPLPDGAETFDFLIAPYSRSNYNGNKLWPLQNWVPVIEQLQVARPGCKIGILGQSKYDRGTSAEGDPWHEPWLQTGGDVRRVFDRPIGDVGWMMNKAGKVITIDNGMGHLAFASQAKHLLLASKAVPLPFINSGECQLIYEFPSEIKVDDVVRLALA